MRLHVLALPRLARPALILPLSAILLLSLGGCGEGDDNEDVPGGSIVSVQSRLYELPDPPEQATDQARNPFAPPTSGAAAFRIETMTTRSEEVVETEVHYEQHAFGTDSVTHAGSTAPTIRTLVTPWERFGIGDGDFQPGLQSTRHQSIGSDGFLYRADDQTGLLEGRFPDVTTPGTRWQIEETTAGTGVSSSNLEIFRVTDDAATVTVDGVTYADCIVLSYTRVFTRQEQIGLQTVETSIDSSGFWTYHPGTGLIHRRLVEEQVDAQEVAGQLVRVTTTVESIESRQAELPSFMVPAGDG